jgi:hypothetical protein
MRVCACRVADGLPWSHCRARTLYYRDSVRCCGSSGPCAEIRSAAASTATATATPTAAATSTPTSTATPAATATSTPAATATNTATNTPTNTPTGAPVASTRIKDITFEGGSLTDAVSGVDVVNGTVTLESSTPINGAYAARVANATSSYLREDFAGVDDLYVAFYLRVTSLPSANTRIVQIVNSGTTLTELQLTSTGKLRLRNAGTTIGADLASLTVGSVYRVGLHQQKGGGADGVIAAYLAGDAAFGSPFAASVFTALCCAAALATNERTHAAHAVVPTTGCLRIIRTAVCQYPYTSFSSF